MKTRTYQRLSDREREEISRGLAAGETQAAIARRISRCPSTVSREVRSFRWRSEYRATTAANRAQARASLRRRGQTKLAANPRLASCVRRGLRKRWSPREIVMRLGKEYPEDASMRVSHETIYRYIYVLPRGALKKELISALRHEHKYRRKRGGKKEESLETRGKIADMLSIEERPKEVEDRVVPGHWEGDLVVGKNKRTAIGTLVERTTRYTLIVPLKAGKDAASVRKAYARALQSVPKELAKTLTYDQGKEMSQHTRFTVDTGIQVYFAHPGSPWERGTNENTNGLIRQYFPKGTDFSNVTAREIKRVQRQLNDRPRAALDFDKPDEAFNKLVALNS